MLLKSRKAPRLPLGVVQVRLDRKAVPAAMAEVAVTEAAEVVAVTEAAEVVAIAEAVGVALAEVADASAVRAALVRVIATCPAARCALSA